jgi:hypothetical protein
MLQLLHESLCWLWIAVTWPKTFASGPGIPFDLPVVVWIVGRFMLYVLLSPGEHGLIVWRMRDDAYGVPLRLRVLLCWLRSWIEHIVRRLVLLDLRALGSWCLDIDTYNCLTNQIGFGVRLSGLNLCFGDEEPSELLAVLGWIQFCALHKLFHLAPGFLVLQQLSLPPSRLSYSTDVDVLAFWGLYDIHALGAFCHH